MGDVTAAAAAASVATAGASVAGLPPQAVILCAVAGAVIGVWVSHADGVTLSWRWALAAVGMVLAYTGFAILGTSVATALFPAYAITAPLARIPEWAISGTLALGGWWVLPVMAAAARRWVDRKSSSHGGGE